MTHNNERERERDELIMDLAGILAPKPKTRRILHISEDREIVIDAPKMADAILAAGYVKPRQVTTVEQLDALPVGSIVLDRTGDAARRFPGGWRTTVAEPDGSGWLSACMEDADLPVTVIYVGSL